MPHSYRVQPRGAAGGPVEETHKYPNRRFFCCLLGSQVTEAGLQFTKSRLAFKILPFLLCNNENMRWSFVMSWLAPSLYLRIEILLSKPEHLVYSDPGWLAKMRSLLSGVGPSTNLTVNKKEHHTKTKKKWTQREGDGERHREKRLWADQGLRKNQPWSYLDLRLLVSRTVWQYPSAV